MGNSNKNNQNRNNSADVQAAAANGDEKENGTTTATEIQSNTEQQGNAVTGNDTVDNDANPPAPVVSAVPPADKKGDDADKTDGTGGTPPAPTEGATVEKTVTMMLRHKSHTPHYHRCGLTLTKVFAEYEVPKDCVERIKGDKWIEVKGAK